MKIKFLFAGAVVALLVIIAWLQIDAREARIRKETEQQDKQKAATANAEIASLLYLLDEVEKQSDELNQHHWSGPVPSEYYLRERQALDTRKAELKKKLAGYDLKSKP